MTQKNTAKSRLSTQGQFKKFVRAARDSGADDNEEAFKRRLAKVAKSPAPKAEKK